MKRYKFVLIDIDTQNDFMNPQGALYMPGAVDIIPNLERLFHWAADNKIPVISTVDAHVPDDPEFREFPPHCVVGTWGHQKIATTTLNRSRLSRVGENDQALTIETMFQDFPQIIFQKQTYTVFDNKNIEKALAEIPAEIFVVCGVATDYCVGAVVGKLLELNRTVWLITDAIAAVDPAKGQACLESFRSQGVRLVTSSDVVGSL